MKKTYHIGCSGYYYPAWKQKFYPEGLQPKNWLPYYSSVFNTVELNGTFYRIPKVSDLKKQAAVTPDDFTFSVKVNKSITHQLKLKNSQQAIFEFQDTIQQGLEHKLACFLFQMPPSFQFNEENLERIIQNIPHHAHNVIELRHASWWNDTVRDALTQAGITFCQVDFPGLKTYIMPTTSVFYMRFHGNPILFKSLYSVNELDAFYQQFPDDCKDYRIYFNNTYDEAGYTNASQLMDLVKK